MSNETVRLGMRLRIPELVGAVIEEHVDTGIPLSDWAEMSDGERDERGQDLYLQWIEDKTTGGWWQD